MDATDKAEPIQKTDPKDPIEPTEHADPIDPIESTERLDAIERNESSDQSDHFDVPDCAHAVTMRIVVARSHPGPAPTFAALLRRGLHPPCAGLTTPGECIGDLQAPTAGSLSVVVHWRAECPSVTGQDISASLGLR